MILALVRHLNKKLFVRFQLDVGADFLLDQGETIVTIQIPPSFVGGI